VSEITCAEVEPLLPLIADGVVDAAAEPAIFAHLAGCQECQEALFRHDLVSVALVGAPMPPRSVTRRIHWPWAVASAASLAAVCALAWPETPARVAAPAVATVAPDIEVLTLSGGPTGLPITVLRRGKTVVILPPAPTSNDGTPVAYRRY
jgi:hypothetical protein